MDLAFGTSPGVHAPGETFIPKMILSLTFSRETISDHIGRSSNVFVCAPPRSETRRPEGHEWLRMGLGLGYSNFIRMQAGEKSILK